MAKILLVEDDKSLREIYGVRLMAEGYEIVSAGDGEEALAMAIKERPNLIVSDVMMPKISGFDMLDILRSTTETKDVKVIMMTALSSDDQRARGEALGDGIPGAAAAPTTFPPAPAAAPAPTSEPITPSPTPSPAPEVPAAPAMPTPTPSPEPAPVAPAPMAPPAVPAMPTPTPVVEPVAPPVINLPPAPAPFTPPAPAAPVTPAPTPAPILPEPTAPFSSPRPASLGDRIINPIDPTLGASPVNDIAAQMNQELNATMQAQTPPLPPQPPVPPAPTV